MLIENSKKLAALIKQERGALLARWRQHVKQLPSAKLLDTPTLNDHIPDLLDELAEALNSPSMQTISQQMNEGSPTAHGLQRALDGFDIEEVVTEYNIVRGCVHDLADAHGLVLQGRPFHILNRVLDAAIGLAVQTYSSQRALEVQQRREEYLSFVAHDLRTPLNAIHMTAYLLERINAQGTTGPEPAQMLKILHRNITHLNGLVAKVLEENSNLGTETGIKLVRREFDLWPLVESVVHDLQPLAKTGSTKFINSVPDDMIVYGDASALRRVLQNLVANAIKYTLRGTITIGARENASGKNVECWVSDDGTGIAPDRLDKIFDKLETDPQDKNGMGLGLAVVKAHVEAHGGTVIVESKLDNGTTFKFTLPAKSTDAKLPVD